MRETVNPFAKCWSVRNFIIQSLILQTHIPQGYFSECESATCSWGERKLIRNRAQL